MAKNRRNRGRNRNPVNNAKSPEQNIVQHPSPEVNDSPLNSETAIVLVEPKVEDLVLVDETVAEVEETSSTEESPSIEEAPKSRMKRLYDWGFSLANRAWNNSKNAMNAGIAFVGNYIPTPVVTAWNTGKNTLSAGMRFVGGYIPSRVTVTEYVKSTFNTIRNRVWPANNTTAQQGTTGDSLEKQAYAQVQEIVAKNSKTVRELVANGNSLVDLFAQAVTIEGEEVNVALVQKYLNETIKGLQDGKKQFISIVHESYGVAYVKNISISEFLSAPEIISNIFADLINIGSTEKLNVLCTTPEEAFALAASIGGRPVSSLVRNANDLESGALVLPGDDNSAEPVTNLDDLIKRAIRLATDDKRLAAISERSVADLARVREQVLERFAIQPGLTQDELTQLIQKMAVLVLASNDIRAAMINKDTAIGAFVHSRIKDALVVVEDITDEPELSKDNVAPTLQLTDGHEQPDLVIEVPTVTTVIEPNITLEDSEDEDLDEVEEDQNALDLTAQQQKYDGVLAKLALKVQDFYDEAENDARYEKVAPFALTLHDKLQEAAKVFFAAPSQESLVVFKQSCRDSIKEAEEAFGEHRSLWFQLNAVIRGIIGVLACLTIIPALVVAGSSTHGFYDSFFGKPVTNSAKELADMTLVLDDTHNEVEQAIRNAAAAA